MPHAIIECSENLAATLREGDVCAKAFKVMAESGVFASPNDIKTRLHVVGDFHVGSKGRAGGFVHIIMYLLEGRTVEQRKNLSTGLFAMLKEIAPQADALSVDVREMNREIYQKI